MQDIETGGAGAARDDSVEGALLECHARIRAFVRAARRLAGSEPAGSEDIAATAAALVRYFTEALPLHVADEDVSLAPRLRSVSSVDLEALEREHSAIHACLAALVPAWRTIAVEPSRRAMPGIAEDTERLASLFDAHLAREEAEILPILERALGAEVLEVVRREMRARRER